ncbi:hypothetical protein SAMN02745244_01060 [Tessaracoccus bendigoensis DSM 12906]|uniref:Uncharacterized protein n=1 Tax=Tessaracoccus bendigoensis DSM 12906 TaxID=1123357 RepID=A0A1M6E0N1_9ACTN|nr:hypothetical protein [Tessaracoccus bendigoensis]SHI79036.1 hypothetical protein SAMN02745244_01060 [Tessaracoccus bendigoensis DSM 12906]
MACRTPSVERVADKTQEANNQINKLLEMLKRDEATTKAEFFSQIDAHFKAANVSDGRQVHFNSDIKVEYTSEFSLDKVAAVIMKALEAVAAAKEPSVSAPAMSEKALAAYGDLVTCVAEAAKTSSTASGALAFSMTRLAPGLFAFLRASSVNIQDDETFGSEAVTATAIFYRFMQSIDDVKNEAQFDLALAAYDALIRLKRLQAALIDDLANDKLSIEAYEKKDAAYAGLIARKQKDLDDAHFKPREASRALSVTAAAVEEWTPEALIAPLAKLRELGADYAEIVRTTEERLEANYF